MGIHFTLEEFSNRKSKIVNELKKQNLDGLLIFRHESMYWLTGYDTFGYVFYKLWIDFFIFFNFIVIFVVS